MAVYLVPKKGRPIVVDKAVLFVGRHPECDIVLTESRKVSRKHCCIAQVDSRFVVCDLGSMNGVSVNGTRVEKVAPLQVGDELTIGDVAYVLNSDKQMDAQSVSSAVQPVPEQSGPDRTVDEDSSPRPMVQPPPAPDELSQQFPVAIPDEEQSFKVENTGSNPSPREGGETFDEAEDDVIPLDEPFDVAEYDDDGSLPDV